MNTTYQYKATQRIEGPGYVTEWDNGESIPSPVREAMERLMERVFKEQLQSVRQGPKGIEIKVKVKI